MVQASPVLSMRIADDRSTVATVAEEGDRGPAGQEALDNIVAHVHISMEEDFFRRRRKIHPLGSRGRGDSTNRISLTKSKSKLEEEKEISMTWREFF